MGCVSLEARSRWMGRERRVLNGLRGEKMMVRGTAGCPLNSLSGSWLILEPHRQAAELANEFVRDLIRSHDENDTIKK